MKGPGRAAFLLNIKSPNRVPLCYLQPKARGGAGPSLCAQHRITAYHCLGTRYPPLWTVRPVSLGVRCCSWISMLSSRPGTEWGSEVSVDTSEGRERVSGSPWGLLRAGPRSPLPKLLP